ncbi:MAG: penicillin-binding transpeptidase domain-containing protein [Ruthenibacterium sp.]
MKKPESQVGANHSAVTHSMRLRAGIMAALFIVVGFGTVVYNLVQYQIINDDFYRTKAEAQQLSDEMITPHRGTLYDANMKVLASSATVWTVTADPRSMQNAGTNVNMVATKLAEILGLPVDELMEKLMKTESNYQLIQRKIEKPVADQIETWVKEYNASKAGKTNPVVGINLVEDSKRYYPYGKMASNVVGFTNVDGDGVAGLELYYNEKLTGTPGRIVSAKNALGYDMPGDYKTEHAAQNGNSLVLTIDESIQSSLEKYLGNAVAEHHVGNRGAGIVMDVKTGAILGMATLPTYDLNDPYTLYDPTVAAAIAAIPDDTERTKQRQTAQQSMWRNKAVQDTYEPGSVFKVVTASAALDSGKANLNTSFNCTGSIPVADHTMRCAKTEGHGTLDFFGGLDNSCNPYFIQLSWQLGVDTFCDYMQAFGFYEKTGIDLPNEAQSNLYKREKMGITELSSSSFGQSSTVTPLAMITAVSAAVNGGDLVQPYLVQQVLDSDGNILENHETVVKRQAISAETSATIASLLEQSVDGHHNKAAYLAGYRVGGKSGTSQKQSVIVGNEDDHLRIASFVGFAPADDPQVAVLIVLDEPNSPTGLSYGGTLCGPVVRNVLADVMPYLNVNPEYSDADKATMETPVPTVIEKTVSEAEALLNETGFNYVVNGAGDKVTYQYPAAGTLLRRQSTIVLYTEQGSEGAMVVVPDVANTSMKIAMERIKMSGLNVNPVGVTIDSASVRAVMQDIPAGTEVPQGTVVNVTFHDTTATD